MSSFGMTREEYENLLGELASRDARCLNPDCDARLSYRASQRGRQALYCDDECRRSTWRRRRSLRASLQAVIESHAMIERPATAQRLRAAEAKLRWLLARYPSDPSAGDEDFDSGQADHPPLSVIFARMDDDWTEEALADAGRFDARMRLKYLNRRERPVPTTPTPEARRRAAIAREQRLEVERLVLAFDT